MTAILAYGHHSSSLTTMIMDAIVHSVVWHVVGAFFRGHGLLGCIAIGVVAIAIIAFLRRRGIG